MIELVAVALIVVHTVDGFAVAINVDQIVVLYPSKEAQHGKPNELIAPGIRCVISLTDGKRVSVIEECSAVQTMIEGK